MKDVVSRDSGHVPIMMFLSSMMDDDANVSTDEDSHEAGEEKRSGRGDCT